MDNEIKIDGISEKSAIAFTNRAIKCSDFIALSKGCFSTYEVMSKIAIIFDKKMDEYGSNILCQGHEWLTEGLKCDVLEPMSEDWQKGRIKMKLSVSFEFTPEADESRPEDNSIDVGAVLDEIRQME